MTTETTKDKAPRRCNCFAHSSAEYICGAWDAVEPTDDDLWDMWQAVMACEDYRNADERTRAIAYGRTVLSCRVAKL